MKEYFRKKQILFAVYMLLILGVFIVLVLRPSKVREITSEIKEMISEGSRFLDGSLQLGLEEFLMDQVQEELSLKEVYGSFHKVLAKNEIDQFYYIKDKDGMMYYGSRMQEKVDTFSYVKRVQSAMKVAENKGARTLFVMMPTKILYGMTDLQGLHMLNDRNAISDQMLLHLQYLGVPSIDMRADMIRSGYSLEELFYKTDNVWTTKGAFIAAKAIADKLRTKFDENIDSDYYFDESRYVEEHWEGNHGTFSRRAGVIYAGTDTFTTMYPRFDTRMKWEVIGSNETVEGRFEETLLDFDWDKDEAEPNPVNELYLSGIVDYGRITNYNNPQGPKILCIRDSSFSAVASFLAPICSRIDLIYMRSSETNLDYEKLIEEGDYDYLMIVGNPYNLDDNNFDYYIE